LGGKKRKGDQGKRGGCGARSGRKKRGEVVRRGASNPRRSSSEVRRGGRGGRPVRQGDQGGGGGGGYPHPRGVKWDQGRRKTARGGGGRIGKRGKKPLREEREEKNKLPIKFDPEVPGQKKKKNPGIR